MPSPETASVEGIAASGADGPPPLVVFDLGNVLEEAASVVPLLNANVAAEVRHFAYKQRDEALDWLRDGTDGA